MKRGKYESGHTQFEEDKVKDQASMSSNSGSILQYFYDVIYLLGIIMIVLLLVLRIVIVSGSSMKETLVDGDYLLLLNNTFYTEPRQGDIVVIVKDSFRGGEPIIKRVIAVGGQTVDLKDGVVYVNGIPMVEAYTTSPTDMQDIKQYPLTIPEGSIFVLGDNRIGSQDSRSTDIGMIDNREVMGKVLLLLLPGSEGGNITRDFSRIGVLP